MERTRAANSVMSAWTPTAVPPDWTCWRDRWEYAHTASFVLKLAGFGALLASVLIETAGSGSAAKGLAGAGDPR